MKLEEDEKIVHELKPDQEVLVIWFFTKSLVFALVGGFLAFGCFGFFGGMLAVASNHLNFNLFSSNSLIVILGFVIFFLLAATVYCRLLHKTHRYVVTNKRCIFIGGIFCHVERSIPYHKITDVEQSKNIFERMLGIGSLNLFTAGSSSISYSPFTPFKRERAEICFEGLKDTETPAETINNYLKQFRNSAA